jgi:hypothetical protein
MTYITPRGFRFTNKRDYELAMEAEGRAPVKPSLDPTERLLAEQARAAGGVVSWGAMPSAADKRRREVDRLLEKFGVKPRRW